MEKVSWLRKGWVLVAAAVCFGFALYWPGLEEPHPLKLAMGTRMGSEALAFALSQNEAFPSDQLRLVEMFGATAISRALENEVVDAAILSIDEALQMNNAGHPVRIALIVEESMGSDVLLGGASLKNVGMLRGKRVGVELRSSGHYLLHKALESAGLALSDVDLIPLTARETPGVLASNEVDALVVTEPDARRVGTVDAVRLFDSSQLKNPIMRVLAVREAVWKTHEKVLRKLVGRYFQEQPKMNADNESFLIFLERRIPLRRDQTKECLKLCRFLNREETLEWLGSGRFKALMEEKADDMIRAELLRKGKLNSPSWDVDFYTF